MKVAACLLLVLAASLALQAHGLGNALVRSAGKQKPLPITASSASSSGWQRSGSCVPGLGTPYNMGSSGPVTASPITLYFANNGQISGFGTDVFGSLPANWVSRGYYLRVGSGQYRIQAATRAYGDACGSSSPFPDTIGDRVVLNPNGINQTLPANEKLATMSKWTRGACIKGMGRHWEFDFQSAPYQSYNSSNMLPVVPMYDPSTSNLNAVFFASTDVQQGLLDSHQWDIIPIPGVLMCKNFCGNCQWPSLGMWSTMHIWFGSTSVSCPSEC
jgi:hypothetical protein